MIAQAVSAALMSEAASVESSPSELPSSQTHAAHSGALVMLGVIFLTLGLVAAFGFYLRRRERTMRPTQALLDSLRDTVIEPPTHPTAARWEKPADWWKH